MGLGFAHKAFVRSNAMLALSEIFKFYDKDIAHFKRILELILKLINF